LFFKGGFLLKKEYSIKKNSEIEKIIQRKNSVGDQFFVIYKAEQTKYPHFRFAQSVSKKFGNAVKRNLVKRRVREIILQNQFKSNHEFFIVIKPAANKLEFLELKNDLEKLFARAKILEG